MEIDWTQIRGALSRIDAQLSKARRVIRETDADEVLGWPEFTRAELEAAVPDWRQLFGDDWRKDFLHNGIGSDKYRVRHGGRRYRIHPEALKALGIEKRR